MRWSIVVLLLSVSLAGCTTENETAPGDESEQHGDSATFTLHDVSFGTATETLTDTFTGTFSLQDSRQLSCQVSCSPGHQQRHSITDLFEIRTPTEINIQSTATFLGEGDLDIWVDGGFTATRGECDCPLGGTINLVLQGYATGGAIDLVVQYDEFDTGQSADYTVDVEISPKANQLLPGMIAAVILEDPMDQITISRGNIVMFGPDDQQVSVLEGVSANGFTLGDEMPGEYVLYSNWQNEATTIQVGLVGDNTVRARLLDESWTYQEIQVGPGGRLTGSVEAPSNALYVGACGWSDHPSVGHVFIFEGPEGEIFSDGGPDTVADGWGSCWETTAFDTTIVPGDYSATFGQTGGNGGWIWIGSMTYER